MSGFERKGEADLDARVRAVAERARAAGTVREAVNGELRIRRVEPEPQAAAHRAAQESPILDWLAANGRGSAPQIAVALGRDKNSTGARLRQLQAAGRVRRTGELLETGRGPAEVLYELSEQEDDMAAIETASREQLTADELQELLEGWAGAVTIAEASASTLALALKARRVVEAMQANEAEDADG
jgi:DNA-binding Lrp family transcriptional regulator